MTKKNIANPLKKIIPAKLNIFSKRDGRCSLSKNLPVTNLKLKIAITGAITNDKTVAKSTKSLRLFSNWNMMIKAPLAKIIKKIM